LPPLKAERRLIRMGYRHAVAGDPLVQRARLLTRFPYPAGIADKSCPIAHPLLHLSANILNAQGLRVAAVALDLRQHGRQFTLKQAVHGLAWRGGNMFGAA